MAIISLSKYSRLILFICQTNRMKTTGMTFLWQLVIGICNFYHLWFTYVSSNIVNLCIGDCTWTLSLCRNPCVWKISLRLTWKHFIIDIIKFVLVLLVDRGYGIILVQTCGARPYNETICSWRLTGTAGALNIQINSN